MSFFAVYSVKIAQISSFLADSTYTSQWKKDPFAKFKDVAQTPPCTA